MRLAGSSIDCGRLMVWDVALGVGCCLGQAPVHLLRWSPDGNYLFGGTGCCSFLSPALAAAGLGASCARMLGVCSDRMPPSPFRVLPCRARHGTPSEGAPTEPRIRCLPSLFVTNFQHVCTCVGRLRVLWQSLGLLQMLC